MVLQLAEYEMVLVSCVALLRELADQCRERLRQLEQLLRALIRGPVFQVAVFDFILLATQCKDMTFVQLVSKCMSSPKMKI